MLRLILAAVGVTAAIILAPTVDAQPGFCDNHGTGHGQIYITACAPGSGGGGPWITYMDENGVLQTIRERDLYEPKPYKPAD